MLLMGRSECYSDAVSGLPDQSAAFFCAAVKQLKPWRKLDTAVHLQAGAACGVIDYRAINDRRLRADDNLGNT
jgi:hypothetical protein